MNVTDAKGSMPLHCVHVLGGLQGEHAPGRRLGPGHCIASSGLGQVLQRCSEIIFQRKNGHLEKRKEKRKHREKMSIHSENNLWRAKGNGE